MASPAASAASQADASAPKKFEQITFRFCAECSNMLYPKEDDDSHQLQFVCRTCQYTEQATSSCVFRNVLNNAAGETAGVTQDVGSDPTVGDPSSVSSVIATVMLCGVCGIVILCQVCGKPACVDLHDFLPEPTDDGRGSVASVESAETATTAGGLDNIFSILGDTYDPAADDLLAYELEYEMEFGDGSVLAKGQYA